MPKRGNASVNNVISWLKRGDGQGEWGSYKPFLRVRDVPSDGRSAMFEGLKTGRMHHYLSDIEYHYHLLAEFAPEVSDIREQFALLPWDEPQSIAQSLGITYPKYPGTDTPIVMTSDIVLTIENSTNQEFSVISVKPASRLVPSDPRYHRTLEKLLIEKVYWQRRHVQWSLCTDAMLPITKVRNLDILRPTMVSRESDWLNSLLPEFSEILPSLCSDQHSLNSVLLSTATHFGCSVDDAFKLFGRSVWMHLVPVDLHASLIDHQLTIPMKSS